MAEQEYNANQNRNSNRPRRTDSVGRARQRALERQAQVQRERAQELRQSLGRSALEGVKMPSLKSVKEKLADLNPSPVRERRETRRPVRQVQPAQSVLSMPQRKSTSSSARPLLQDRRPRRVAQTQGKMPPVLVRGGMPDMAVRKTRQGMPKRRYEVALGIPGAELQLPSLPMVKVGWRALSGLLAAMMVACLFILWKSPAFQVNTVEAEGLQRLSVGDLNGVMDILGSSVFSLDPEAIQWALKQNFPELSSITVRVGLPAKVLISVTERQPVLSWYQNESEVWVDAEGVAFLPRGNPGTLVRVAGQGETPAAIAGVAVPLVNSVLPNGMTVPAKAGDEAAAFADPASLPVDLVQAIVTLGGMIPAEIQLVYDSSYGLGWEDPLGWEVYFGLQTSEMQQRLVVYQGVVDYLIDHGLQPELVSVEFLHAPYYRMER